MENVHGYPIKTISKSYSDFLAALGNADWVLTPTRRLSTRLNQDFAQYQASLDQKLWQVQIISLAGFLDTLWQDYQDEPNHPHLLRLNAWQNQLLWQNVVEETIQTPLLRKGSTAKLAASAWKLLNEWQINYQDLPQDLISPDVATFIDCASAYAEKCCAMNCCDDSSKLAYLQNGRLAKCERIYLVGFTDLTPSTQALLAQFASLGAQIEIIEYTEKNPEIYCAPQPSPQAEFTQAALWAKDLLAKQPLYPIGIVIPDIALRWNEVDQIFSSILMPECALATHAQKPRPYNISAGEKLADFPVIKLAFALLDFNPYKINLSDLSTILLSPFIAGAQSEQMCRAALDAKLRYSAHPQVSRDALQVCPQFYQIITQLKRISHDLLLPSVWAEVIKQQLSLWGFPGERVLNSQEYQVVRRFYEFLSEFALLDCVQGEINYAKACYLLKQQAQSLLFQGESEDKPIQILGHLEAAGLYFHALWVTGLHDENWPQACKPHPFLPISLQREKMMPHASSEREYLFAKNLTQQYTEQAKSVILSYPQRIGDKACMLSRLIQQYPLKIIAMPSLAFEHLPLDMRVEWQEENIPLQQVVSAGAGLLQAQKNCPFQAFARYRLKAKNWQALEPGISALLRGQLVHQALENFWQAVQSSQKLHEMDAVLCNQYLDKAIDSALDTILANLPQQLILIEKQRLHKLLQEWIMLEKNRAAFTVLAHEKEITHELAGIKLRMRIDRVDRLETGEIVLIDYKTGVLDKINWQDPHPLHLQLPLYAISYPETLQVLYAQIKANHIQTQASPVLPEWQDMLTQLAEDFSAGNAKVAPLEDAQTCQYCEFNLLCRKEDVCA